jgi:chaperonin GroES
MKRTGHILPGKVLIRQDKGDDTTDGGIVIPDNLKEKKKSGTILLLGDKLDKNTLEVGDSTLFDENAGTELNLDNAGTELNGDVLLLSQSQVLFYIKDKK